MSDSDVIFEVNGTQAVIRLNRPSKYNALTLSMYAQLADIFDDIGRNGSLRVIRITSTSDKAFAAGTDISEFLNFSSGSDGLIYEREIDHVLEKFVALKPVTVAEIHGVCTGGGAAISMACDLRYSTPSLRFGYPIAKTLGNCLGSRTLELLLDSVGVAKTKELLLTAKLWSADEALSAGAINNVFPAESISMEVDNVCSTIDGLAPLALNAVKQGIRRIVHHRSIAAEALDDLIESVYASVDFHDAVRAFLRKEPPVWHGR